MPLALEPGGRYPVVLESDADKPADSRPTFYFRALSGRKWREAARISDGLERHKDSFVAIEQLYDALLWGLVDWENMIDPDTGEPIPFDPAELDAILQPPEAAELVPKMLGVGQLTRAERKNSASPRSSNTASCAANAGPAAASNAPASESRPKSNAAAAEATAATSAKGAATGS
jgi:hypothetical protein